MSFLDGDSPSVLKEIMAYLLDKLCKPKEKMTIEEKRQFLEFLKFKGFNFTKEQEREFLEEK